MTYTSLMRDHLQRDVKEMTLPLAMLPEGAKARVVGVYGGRGLTRRLAEIGFNAGVVVRIVQNHSPGPTLIEVKDSRVCLGRGVAMKIMVEEVR